MVHKGEKVSRFKIEWEKYQFNDSFSVLFFPHIMVMLKVKKCKLHRINYRCYFVLLHDD